MQNKNRFFVLLMICGLILTFVAPCTVRAEESIAPKKIISIVYDDSTSMLDNRIIPANYATQVFAALMNPQDELYITYMSDISAGSNAADKFSLGDGDIDKTISKIRKKEDLSGGTPLYQSSRVALDALLNSKDTDPNTQFWLVIMTDGELEGMDLEYFGFADVDDMLKDYKGTVMSNGSNLYIYYFGIGSKAATVKEDKSNRLEAVNRVTDIVSVLGTVANTISGRVKYDPKEITIIDDHTIEVKSDVALYSLSALSQNSSARVVSAQVSTAEISALPLTVDRNVQVEKDNTFDEYTFKDNYYGNVAVINNGTTVIPAGKYTITFSEKINTDSLVVMYQPAIAVSLSLLRNGTEITDPSVLSVEDDIELKIIPKDLYTGEVIDDSLLPKDTKWEVSISIDGNEQTESGQTVVRKNLGAGDYKIRGSMIIPGMIPIGSNIFTFSLSDYIPEIDVHLVITRKGMNGDVVAYDNVEGINNMAGLESGDELSVHAEAYDRKTGDLIDAARLGGTEDWLITYSVDSSEKGSVNSNQYDGIVIDSGKNEIRCVYKILDTEKEAVVPFDAAIHSVYSFEVDEEEYTYDRSELTNETEDVAGPLVRVIRDEDKDRDGVGDGKQQVLAVSEMKEENTPVIKKVNIEPVEGELFLNRIGWIDVDMELVQNGNDGYTVVPTVQSWITRFFFPYLIQTGEYHVVNELEINGETEEVVIKVNGKLSDWLRLLEELLAIFIILYILVLIFGKKKFKKGSDVEVVVFRRGAQGEGVRMHRTDYVNLHKWGENPLSHKPAVITYDELDIKVYAGSQHKPCLMQSPGPWGEVTHNIENNFDGVVDELLKLKEEKENDPPKPGAMQKIDENSYTFFLNNQHNKITGLIYKREV